VIAQQKHGTDLAAFLSYPAWLAYHLQVYAVRGEQGIREQPASEDGDRGAGAGGAPHACAVMACKMSPWQQPSQCHQMIC